MRPRTTVGSFPSQTIRSGAAGWVTFPQQHIFPMCSVSISVSISMQGLNSSCGPLHVHVLCVRHLRPLQPRNITTGAIRGIRLRRERVAAALTPLQRRHGASLTFPPEEASELGLSQSLRTSPQRLVSFHVLRTGSGHVHVCAGCARTSRRGLEGR